MSDTHIIFDGSNGISSDTFVRVTRQRSLAEGKEKDDEWIALSAASCLEGDALDWYELQNEEVQESWRLLRRALLIRWPRATASAPPPEVSPLLPPVGQSRFNIPTPAAAPPPSAPSDLSTAPLVSNPTPTDNIFQSTGIFRMITKSGDFLGYISRFTDSSGGCKTTRTRAEALIVRADRFGFAHEFVITNSPTSRYAKECLGIIHGNARTRMNEACENGGLWGATIVSIRPDPSSSTGWRAASESNQSEGTASMWNTIINGTVTPVWKTPNSALFPLDVVVIDQTRIGNYGSLRLTTNTLKFAECKDSEGYTLIQVDLIFERMP